MTQVNTPLHKHIVTFEDYYAVYERYQPDEALLGQLRENSLTPHVRVYYSDACGECARHIPALARIAEQLPDWTWEMIDQDEARLYDAECPLITPVINVTDGEGQLLGAINGNPVRGSLEADLLHITSMADEESKDALHPTTT